MWPHNFHITRGVHGSYKRLRESVALVHLRLPCRCFGALRGINQMLQEGHTIKQDFDDVGLSGSADSFLFVLQGALITREPQWPEDFDRAVRQCR